MSKYTLKIETDSEQEIHRVINAIEKSKSFDEKKAEIKKKFIKCKTETKVESLAPKADVFIERISENKHEATEVKPTVLPEGVLKTVHGVIKRTRKGISIKKIKDKTGFGPRQVSNALYKLTKQHKIETASRGVYVTRRRR